MLVFHVLQLSRDAVEQRKELESEHTKTLAQLEEKREQVARLTEASASEKEAHLKAVQTLQARVVELEKETERQHVRHEGLLRDLAAAKRSSASATVAIDHQQQQVDESRKQCHVVQKSAFGDDDGDDDVYPRKSGRDEQRDTNHSFELSPDSGTASPGSYLLLFVLNTYGITVLLDNQAPAGILPIDYR